MDAWTPEQHKTYQLCERYLNSAQRRLNRHRSDILQYQSNLRSQARENRAAKDYAKINKSKETAKQEAETAAPTHQNDSLLQQVNVAQINGKTMSFFTPDNKHLLDNLANFRDDTTLVLRSLRFHEHVVPPEYEPFTERAAKLRTLPGDGRITLPITIRSLRVAVEREKEFGGHLREWPDLRALDHPIIQAKNVAM
jgi:hypothetical protein